MPPREPNQSERLPSGLRVDYWAGIGKDGKAQQRRYRVEGEKVPSVTQITGIFEKKGFPPAVERLTVKGMLRLARELRNHDPNDELAA